MFIFTLQMSWNVERKSNIVNQYKKGPEVLWILKIGSA